MMASGPMGLIVLCLFQVGGAQLEARARVETMAGEMPTGDLGNSIATVTLAATPSLRLDWFAGADLLQADLSTRILWRPVPLPRARPLFLETLGVTHSVRPTLRSQWRFQLNASYGQQDYTSLSRQFSTQPTLPRASTMFMVNGEASALWRSSRRTTLEFRLGALHRRSWEEEDSADQPANASMLPSQTMVTAVPGMRLAMGRRLTASVSAPITVYDISAAGVLLKSMVVFSVQPQISLLALLSRRERLRVAAGLTYADIVRGTATDFGHHVTPLALLGLDSDIHRSRFATVRSFVEASTAWFADPVLGRGIWRGSAQAGVDAQVGPRWSARLSFSSAADISRTPSDNTSTTGTVVAATSSVSYQWTNVLAIEVGGQYSERGPYIASSDFAWRGRELLGFLTLATASRMNLTNVRPVRSLSGSGI